MENNFGLVKEKTTEFLKVAYSTIDNLLSGDNSLLSLKRELESFIDDENSNISKTEQSFIDLISVIVSSLRSINGIISSTEVMSNNGCPIIIDVLDAIYGSDEYLNLTSIKLWNKFRDSNLPAYLVDVYGNRFISTSRNGLFYVQLVMDKTLQEPSYREDFNVEPYQIDNKTVYLYLGDNLSVKDEDDNVLILNKDYSVNNLRTYVPVEIVDENGNKQITSEIKHNMIYVYKNDENKFCAELTFEVGFPFKDREDIGYPKNYFMKTVNLNYDLESKKYSLRVINDIS